MEEEKQKFGFYISFSKFQDLGIARVVERDYIRGTDMLEAMELRGKRLKKLAFYVEAFLHRRWEIPSYLVVISGP